jgi:hypothetical protein
MSYLSVVNFWKYQDKNAWKKARTHPPWFKHYVHHDRDLDCLPIAARLLFFELLAAATRYENVLGSGVENSPPLKAEDDLNAIWSGSEADLNWIWMETRIEPEVIAEMLPMLVKGGWLSQTKTRRRVPKPVPDSVPDPVPLIEEDVDVDGEEDLEVQDLDSKAGLLPLLEDVARAREDHDASGLPFSQSLGDLVKPIVAHEVDPVLALLKELDDADSGTETILRSFRLPEYAYRQAIEVVCQRGHTTGLAVSVLRRVQGEIEADRATYSQNGDHADEDIPL